MALDLAAQRITADELLTMPRSELRYELIAGELKQTSPAGFEHGAVTMRLGRRLANHVEDRSLGIVLGAETGFLLRRDPDTVRAADVAFVSQDRLPESGLPKGFFPGAPDLAVEVLSPHDTFSEVDEKVAEWLSAGARLVWTVNPRWRNVTVYLSPTQMVLNTADDELDGLDVIPGFHCRVGDLFV